MTLGDHKCRFYDYGETVVPVKSWKLHPKYNLTQVTTMDDPEFPLGMTTQYTMYDFAIITMNTSVSLSSTIIPACLPKDPTADYAWEKVRTSGWGLLQNRDSEGRRKRVNELMQVDLTVLPYTICRNASKYESNMDTTYISQSYMLCVGFAKPIPFAKATKGIYSGDSGGRCTTFIINKNMWHLF